MRVDLHCHTKCVKDGEKKSRNVDAKLFASKIQEADVGIVAITNHNVFDKKQFIEFQEYVSNTCMLWPGIELDMLSKENSVKYHLIIVGNPNELEEFADVTSNLIGGIEPNQATSALKDVLHAFASLDVIYLPHFHKDPKIPSTEYRALLNGVKNKNRVIREAQNISSMGILINHDMNSIVGSDVHNWSTYPGKELPELRLPVNSFENFCRLLDRDSVVVKTLLDKKSKREIKVNPRTDKNPIADETHTFYADVNIIMGDKGTGKSEIIKDLETYFRQIGIPVSVYISSETLERLQEEQDTSDMQHSTAKLGINNCEQAFQILEDWADLQPTPFSSYISYYRNKTHKVQSQDIKWHTSKLLDLHASNQEILEVSNDQDSVTNAVRMLHSDTLDKYLSTDDSVMLTQLLAKLIDTIKHRNRKKIIEYLAIQSTNRTISQFKKLVSEKTNSSVKPDGVGFMSYARNRMKLISSIDVILAAFDVQGITAKESKTYTLMGAVGEKGEIFMEERYRLLDTVEKSIRGEFDDKITRLREIYALLKKMPKFYYTNQTDLFDDLKKLVDQIREANVNSLDDFVGTYRQTVDRKHQPYVLSNGERAMIFIQRALNQEADVYLLDEPEQSMANSYIDEIIRPKLMKLGKINKIVIVATHNANIAVRTLPYTTMYRSHGGKGYQTYDGNMFDNRLENIKEPEDILDWKEVSLSVLEGSRDAFNERKEIYSI